MEPSYRAFALCALGLEKILSNEIERLGLKPAGRSPGRVYFDADLAGLFKANLCLRTAERVLLEAARFKAPDFDALFEGVKAVAWEDWLGATDKLVIERVRIRDSQLDAQTSVQAMAHKAAYTRLCKVYGQERMPETGESRSARIYLEEDECLVGLDLSGEALHKRGYRKATVEAPLKETIAAACLYLSGWNRRLSLIDPFCGSGTILIEAALIGSDTAPGLGRDFAMETMPFGKAEVFAAERAAAKARIRDDAELSLKGSDTDESALAAAKSNAERAGVSRLIAFSKARAEDLEPPADPGYLITDPPYGNRLGTEDEAVELYKKLGELAPSLKGWGLGFVTNRQDFGTHFGRRAIAEHKVMNGAEEQWFHWYSPGYEDKPPRPFVDLAPKEAEEGPKKERHGPRKEKPHSGPPRTSPPRSSGGAYGDRAPRRDNYRDGERSGRGDKPRFERERPSYGDRPRPSYGDRPKPSYGDRKPSGDRPSYGDKPRFERERPSYGDRPKPSYGDRPKPSYGDRKPSGDRPSYGDKPRFERERPSYGDRPRPNYGDRKPAGDRPSYGDRPRPSYGDRKPASDRPSYGDRPRPSYGDRKPAGDRPSYGDRPRPSYGDRKPSGDRPSYGDRPRPSYGDRKPAGGRPSYGDRPRPPRREPPKDQSRDD